MSPILKPIADSFHTTNFVMKLCLADLNGNDANKRTRDGDGPSIVWQVEHMLEFRRTALGLLGVDKDSRYPARQTGVRALDGSDHPEVTAYQREWDQVDSVLDAALKAATPELLQGVVEDDVHGEKSVLESLVFLTWHEAYHVGGLTAIRKQLGYPSPAELTLAKVAG